MRRACVLMLLQLCGTLGSACAGLSMPAPASVPAQFAPLPFAQAGVAEVDITPPPGLGLFGHGPEARIAEGTLLRLHCQAFVLVGAALEGRIQRAGTDAEALAFVVCDLPAPSLLLSREVAARVRRAGVPLGADRIWLAATHTHAGPGHYFANENLSGPFSGRRIGFDRAVLDFLAERIAGAVQRAYATRKQARWGWLAADVAGLSRNRAYAALQANASLPEALQQNLAGPVLDPATRAVDLQLALLRIEQRASVDAPYQPAAALVVFGLHPTVIDNHNTLYGGDAFGYATRALAGQLSRQHTRPVLVSFANGIEGDVTAQRAEATPREARRIGRALAAHAVTLWDELGVAADTKLDARAGVRSGYRELVLSKAPLSNGAALCERPELGTPAGGGANDHPTFLRSIAAYNPGVRARDRSGCHGPKYPIQSLDGESQAGLHFPGLAPIGVARIGNGVLVTLPAELTSVAGLRIEESVAEHARQRGAERDVIAVVGLTHEYLEYIATAEEYALQHYEGASTLYGPASAEFLREQVACVSRYTQQGDSAPCIGQPRAINQVGPVRYHLPTFHAPWLARVPDRAAGSPGLSAPRAIRTADGLSGWESVLTGIAPRALIDPAAFGIALVDGAGQLLANEQGDALRVRWDDARRVWLLTWVPDCSQAPPAGSSFRFRVRAGTRRLESPPGTLTQCRVETRSTP